MGIIERTVMWGGYCNATRIININGAHTTQMTVWQSVPVVPSERNSSRKMQRVCVRVRMRVCVCIFSRLGEEND